MGQPQQLHRSVHQHPRNDPGPLSNQSPEHRPLASTLGSGQVSGIIRTHALVGVVRDRARDDHMSRATRPTSLPHRRPDRGSSSPATSRPGLHTLNREEPWIFGLTRSLVRAHWDRPGGLARQGETARQQSGPSRARAPTASAQSGRSHLPAITARFRSRMEKDVWPRGRDVRYRADVARVQGSGCRRGTRHTRSGHT